MPNKILAQEVKREVLAELQQGNIPNQTTL